ncbi:hypothetical protein A5819_003604 [Enterococcus sp. 7E2_DIV0204]|uniref:bifunctional lytic transglycosylase/C40 family peptidase n=1 Tax=unclassified Enterococcus TaxID=2608891 RepID=UPI000A33E3DC|nr:MULTISPECIES: bifunctional lytic transglycosylase/C40 family peptidase [unclassified Enterococcus]OTN84054.1 hypothetical protein A5819_003604 [Enterococcus sp. 7E2_DIV0204]OTP47258.1 hypothetical protein A5884_003633 [Enterococcus sp. 7D2_DIV0200]
MRNLKIKLILIGSTLFLGYIVIAGTISSLTATTSMEPEERFSVSASGLSPEVIALRPDFLDAMKEVGMPEKYIDLLLAICMQESGGRVEDVMQSSESMGHSLPNQIDKKTSIKQGVKVLWNNIKAIGEKKVEESEERLKTAVQAYNYGGGFISFMKPHDHKYSKSLAQQFSTMQAAIQGWGSYGDPDYIDHVWRYLKKGNGNGAANVTGDFKKILDSILPFDGQPYVFGGKNPAMGFDCSGIISWAYAQHGITFPSYTVTQWEQSVPVEKSEAKAGDLIFFRGTYGAPDFISHIEFYIDETTMYGSNSSGVGYHNHTDPYWQQHFAGIRRLVK